MPAGKRANVLQSADASSVIYKDFILSFEKSRHGSKQLWNTQVKENRSVSNGVNIASVYSLLVGSLRTMLALSIGIGQNMGQTILQGVLHVKNC